jgi:hypothetical protein
MNIQQAYNKGLDDAESIAVAKLLNALNGNDDGPFNNPQMEEVRQRILVNGQPKPFDVEDIFISNSDLLNAITNTLLGKTVFLENLSPIERRVIDIMSEVRDISKSASKSKVSVKFRELITELEIDIIKEKSKL